MSSQYCLFYEKYALDFADQYLKWLQITYILFVNTENRMSLRVEGAAQWESCAASFFSIPANILLLGKSLNCLYLSQFLTDFHFLKKHLNASVLPQFWSTHLTSSFNFKFFKTGRANSHCALLAKILDIVAWLLAKHAVSCVKQRRSPQIGDSANMQLEAHCALPQCNWLTSE